VKDKSLGIVSVATNQYLKYWKQMAESLDNSINESDRVFLHLFTDQPTDAKSFSLNLKYCKVKIYEIPSLGWPEATLLRYQIFEKNLEDLTQEILMYLDADMIIVSNLLDELDEMYDPEQVSLVGHPGFWREGHLFNKTRLYAQNPRMAISDLRMKIALGGIGSWESRRASRAFVSRRRRNNYVCGGAWLGPNNLIKKLIIDLSREVTDDQKNNIIAIWHDESHLNSWASKNVYKLLTPKYCHDATYIQLKNLSPAITAVNKEIH